MKHEEVSKAVGNISTRHIEEAIHYSTSTKKEHLYQRFVGRTMIAAVLFIILISGVIAIVSPFKRVEIKAYASGTDKEITASGVVMSTGTISDSGEMVGPPLQFYLSAKDIKQVRFSCKNQQIMFTDWTEKRQEYGLSQNFTVDYGEDASEYYYLVINWEPNGTIRALTDQEDSTIATLPQELREDIIVMQITLESGKTETKAITISLREDGTFFATFDDYKIRDADSFIHRKDSEPIQKGL